MSHYTIPTRKEVGDLSFMTRYAEIRKRMFAPPAPKPKLVPPPQPVREARTCYMVPIQGPCQPHHKSFSYYNGERDVLNVISTPDRISVEDCIRFVCKSAGVSKSELISERRTAAIAHLRQAAMYLARIYTTRSLPDIGRRFSGRDHTTVLHAIRKFEKLVAEGKFVAPSIQEIELSAGRVQTNSGNE